MTADTVSTLGNTLVRGRGFIDTDDEKGEPVVLIDETAAERFLPNEDPTRQTDHASRNSVPLSPGDASLA